MVLYGNKNWMKQIPLKEMSREMGIAHEKQMIHSMSGMRKKQRINVIVVGTSGQNQLIEMRAYIVHQSIEH